MATPIIMPKFGQMTEESAIVEWRKKEGEHVAKGDILFTVETDKSVMDVESFEEGTLLKIAVRPGVSVPVQSTVGFLGKPGEPVPEVPLRSVAQASSLRAGAMTAPPSPALARHENASGSTPSAAPPPLHASRITHHVPLPVFRISPRAAALARDCVIDPAAITGSGPGGRIVEKDVKAYLEARQYGRLRISPAAKALAAKEKLDVLAIAGSEENGRIEVTDVRRAVAQKPRPLSKIRQVIAHRLTQSFRDTPHFYVTVSVDMTELSAYRAQLKNAGAPYTITDFIAQATVLALQEFPDVNSSTDGTSVRWHGHVNLGLAVSLEQGLVVPVIRAAEKMSFAELSGRCKELVDKARAGKATPDDLSGGSFTISNMGMLDVENFGAIINPGESAILAVSSTSPQAVVRDGQIVARQMMKLTLSCDHRVVDGALGAGFINAIKGKLEDLELWKRMAAV